MNTYLIFFGKSQDFTFYVFDENGIVMDFSTNIIKDFDLLESRMFTIDGIDNKPILAKYCFKSTFNKIYSLLKLYSFAQAVDGARIAGSIYGVAILSEFNVLITENNLHLLNNVKSRFSDLCLDRLKFVKSNFIEEASSIWIEFQKINLFQKIDLKNLQVYVNNNNSKAFFVNNLLSDPVKFENEIRNSNRLYFSEDIQHLKRFEDKWGDKFPIYYKNGEKYIEEKTINHDLKKNNDSISTIRTNEIFDFNKSDLEIENNNLKKQLKIESKSAKKKIRIQQFIFVLVLIASNAFFFTKSFHNRQTDQGSQEKYVRTSLENNIVDILNNPTKLDTLWVLSEEIKKGKIQDKEKIKKQLRFLGVQDSVIIRLEILNLKNSIK
jgi:hypothetical protein